MPAQVPPVGLAARRGQRDSGAWRWTGPVLVAAVLILACLPPRPGERAPVYERVIDPAELRPLVLLGDTQRTSVPEVLIGREQNDIERAGIIAAIAAEEPGLLVLLGDGSAARHWTRFDDLTAPLREAAVPVYTVLGNHDYWVGRPAALPHAHARFPTLARSPWQVLGFRGLGLVLLDSNRDSLGPDRWQEQRRWYQETLRELEADDDVCGIVVLLHHPPYTNSTVTGDNGWVKTDLVPDFLAARKTMAMVTGHSHAYEHFTNDDKHFLVSGGGGGPRVTLLAGDRVRHRDAYRGPSPRPFHYLSIDPAADAVQVTVRGFDRGELEPRVLDEIRIPYPRR